MSKGNDKGDVADKYIRTLNIEYIDGEFENIVKEQIRSPEQVEKIYGKIKDKSVETVIGIYTWDDLQPSVYATLGLGTKDCSLIDTDMLFGLAFTLRADYIIVAHNHPSGKATPSPADRETFREIRDMARVNKKKILDFLIFADNGRWSWFEEEDGGDYAVGALA